MKNIKKYTEEGLTQKDLEMYTEQLLKNKFDQENRTDWSEKLREQYDVSRSKSSTASKRRRLNIVLMSVAASALVLVVSTVLFQQLKGPSTQELASGYISNHQLDYDVVRKDVSEASALRLQFAEAVNQKDYPKAIQLGEQVLQSKEVTIDDYLFLGLSYLHQNQAAAAIPHLLAGQNQSGSNGRFSDELSWYLSLAYFQDGQTEKARAIWQDIVDQKEWKQAEAKRLLKSN